jgi:pimeloyl-ACP methyl ester carboxylesterase
MTTRMEMVITVPGIILAPLRFYFQAASRVFPAAAVSAFKWLLSHMPRRALSSQERAFLDGATRLDFKCGDAVLAGYTFGTGPLVLLVHGLQGSAGNYRTLIPALVEQGFRVVAFDAINHGNSPGGVAFSNRTIRDLEQVIAQLDDLHAIVSHSAGTYLTMMALLNFPHKASLRKCVYIAPYPDIATTLRTFTDYFCVPRSVQPQLRRWFEEIGNLPFDEQAFHACLPRHRTPAPPEVLFLHDRDDRHIPFARTEEMLAMLPPGPRLAATDGLGHFKILKDEASIAAIVAFLGADPGA